MLKRILLVSTTQIGVLLTLFFLLHLTGWDSGLVRYGINLPWLFLGLILWGWLGATLMLVFAQPIIWSLFKIRTLLPRFAQHQEKMLCDLVRDQAQLAGLKHIPTLGIYRSPGINAFSLGLSRQHAYIAITSGTLVHSTPKELEGLIAHEIAHIANGDMVTLTLMQGILNAFGLFLTVIISYVIYFIFFLCQFTKEENHHYSMLSYTMLRKTFDFLLFIPGGLIVTVFSRHREWTADRDSAEKVGRETTIAALRRIEQTMTLEEHQPSLAVFTIAQRALFASLPSFEKRIHRLMQLP